MAIYNVTVTLCHEASDEDEAMDKAIEAIDLIPKDHEPTYSEVHYADLNHI